MDLCKGKEREQLLSQLVTNTPLLLLESFNREPAPLTRQAGGDKLPHRKDDEGPVDAAS